MDFLIFEPTYSGRKDEEYVLKFDKKDLMYFTEGESQCMYELTAQLNEIILKYETEAKMYEKMLNILIELVGNTLLDKLDDIDNLYAMKKMMEGICSELGQLANDLESVYSSTEGFNNTFNSLKDRLDKNE